jgi:GT2 family glycosyltransferase
MTQPFLAGYLSGASKIMPRKVVDEVGPLDSRMFYHVDADYCKRIADSGYKCYYLPTAAVIHLNHKGGTRVNARLRFRSLASYHFDCYVYYRKHLQKSVWSPIGIVVVIGLISRFLTAAAIQASAELLSATRSLLLGKRAH